MLCPAYLVRSTDETVQLSNIDGSELKTASQLAPLSVDISTVFTSVVISPAKYCSRNSNVVSPLAEILNGPKIILLSTAIPSCDVQ